MIPLDTLSLNESACKYAPCLYCRCEEVPFTRGLLALLKRIQGVALKIRGSVNIESVL